MKVMVEISPDIVAMMAAEGRAGEKAVTIAMRQTGTGLKSAWRGQITGAGLGTRLANSIRSASFPKSGESLNAAALVWSNAPVIIGAHDTGPLIRSQNGFWLAIPLDTAGAKGIGGKRITPGGWEQRTGRKLRFVYRRGRPSLLVDDGTRTFRNQSDPLGFNAARRTRQRAARKTVPIFLLVPQVKMPKRLTLSRDVDKAASALPGLIVANWKGGGPR